MMFSYTELFVIIAVAIVAGGIVSIVLARTARHPANNAPVPQEPIALLFDGGVLHHATQRALSTFAIFPGIHGWNDLRLALLDRFPDFPEYIVSGASGHIAMSAKDGDNPGMLRIDWRDSLCWVDIAETGAPALTNDARLAMICCDVMNEAAWEIQADGRIGWRNAACNDLLRRLDESALAALTETATARIPERIATNDAEDARDWYRLTDHQAGDVRLRMAHRITANVNAENAQRQLVQTIAKTFAHLSAGLAIFDRQGKLNIFNPALVDLTGLPPHFLANQPDILSFFDQLRENRNMPEPKSYRTWRQDIALLITAAADGQYSETWSLEDGRTFSVKGRPHHDGAIAFMIEDITADVSLSRNFRTEVAQYEAILDATDDALVVFSATGILTFCNRSYKDLWGQDPESAFADVTIGDSLQAWTKGLSGNTHRDEISAFVFTVGQRKERELTLVRRGKPNLTCTLVPIMADATLIRFSAARQARSVTRAELAQAR